MGFHGSARLSKHPNFAVPKPPRKLTHKAIVSYVLRYSAALVSPPMLPGETQERECVDIAAELIELSTLTQIMDALEGKKKNAEVD